MSRQHNLLKVLMRDADKRVPGPAKLTTKTPEHLLPREDLWLYLGSPPGRKPSWEHQRGWGGKRPRVVLRRVTGGDLCRRSPGEAG